MKTLDFDLSFRKMPEDEPGPPIAEVYVKASGTNDQGLTVLGSRCHSYAEADSLIKRLEDQLAHLSVGVFDKAREHLHQPSLEVPLGLRDAVP